MCVSTFPDPQLPETGHAQKPRGRCVCKVSAFIGRYVIVVQRRHQRRDKRVIHPIPVMIYLVHLEKNRNEPI